MISLAIVVSWSAFAQSVPSWAAPASPEAGTPDPPGASAGTPPANPFTPAAVPVDGGLALLALAGAGLAARRLRQRHED